jgi:hypothetical protein
MAGLEKANETLKIVKADWSSVEAAYR